MNNISIFGLGLLVSIIVLTGFGHIIFLLLIILISLLFLFVKKKKTIKRHLWRLLGICAGASSIIFSLYGKEFIQYSNNETVTIKVHSQITSDAFIGQLFKYGKLQETYFRVQNQNTSKDFVIKEGQLLRVLVDEYTQSSYPIISFNTNMYRYPQSFEYPYWLAMKGLDGHIKTHSLYPVGNYSELLVEKVSRNQLLSFLTVEKLDKTFSSKTSGLLRGMIIGGRAGLTGDDYYEFIKSGLVHLVAVSGSNIMLVVALVYGIFFRVPFYGRVVIACLAILGYAIVVGGDSSVLRAVVMGLTTLFALIAGRRVDSTRLLWYTACILLIYNPWSFLYDVGLLLSFGALIGIIVSVNVLKNSRLPSRLSGYIIPSIAATLGVTPILIVMLDGLNLLSPFINIVVSPFVPVLLALGSLGVFFQGVFVTLTQGGVELLYALSSWGAENAIMLEVSTTLSKVIFVCVYVSFFCMVYIVINTKNKLLQSSWIGHTPIRT